jgi:hypothetical protein
LAPRVIFVPCVKKNTNPPKKASCFRPQNEIGGENPFFLTDHKERYCLRKRRRFLPNGNKCPPSDIIPERSVKETSAKAHFSASREINSPRKPWKERVSSDAGKGRLADAKRARVTALHASNHPSSHSMAF